MIDTVFASVFEMLKDVYYFILLDEKKLFQVLCRPNHKLFKYFLVLRLSNVTNGVMLYFLKFSITDIPLNTL
jgi:hypothetical protein